MVLYGIEWYGVFWRKPTIDEISFNDYCTMVEEAIQTKLGVIPIVGKIGRNTGLPLTFQQPDCQNCKIKAILDGKF